MFNTGRNVDCEPLIDICDGKTLDYVAEIKLLGVILSEDLTTKKNTEYMVKKAYKKMWMIRRLVGLGCDRKELIDTYCKQIRPIMEFAVPVWATRITNYEERLIERTQKTALHIIWGNLYTTYENALSDSELETLVMRRGNLMEKFATKTQNNSKFSSWFKPNTNCESNTRSKNYPFKPVPARTERFARSAIPKLTEILNTRNWNSNTRFTCDICGQTFLSRHNLKTHKRFVHNENGNDPQWTAKVL